MANKNRSSTEAGKQPYMRKGFWDKPENQFWEKDPQRYNVEKYREIYNQRKNERT